MTREVKKEMKKYLLVMTGVILCFTFAGSQTAKGQIKIDKSKLKLLLALSGNINVGADTDLKQLAANYKCSDISVKIGNFDSVITGGKPTLVFKTALTGKVTGNIDEGKCSYYFPYDSKVPVKTYDLIFSAPNKFNTPNCPKTLKLDFSSGLSVTYPDTAKSVKNDVTVSLKCS